MASRRDLRGGDPQHAGLPRGVQGCDGRVAGDVDGSAAGRDPLSQGPRPADRRPILPRGPRRGRGHARQPRRRPPGGRGRAVRPAVPRHATRQRRVARTAAQARRQAQRAGSGEARDAGRGRARGRRTPAGSFTATSSPRTSCSKRRVDRVKLTDFGLRPRRRGREAHPHRVRRRLAALHGPGAGSRRRGRSARRPLQPRHGALRGRRPAPRRSRRRRRSRCCAACPTKRRCRSMRTQPGRAPVAVRRRRQAARRRKPAGRYQSAAEVAEVFAAGLAEMYLLSPLDVPAEVCCRRSRTVVRHATADLLEGGGLQGAAVGRRGGHRCALIVGLLWAFTGSDHTPTPEPQRRGRKSRGSGTTLGDLARKLEDPKTTEVALAPGTFDLSSILAGPGRRQEFVVSTRPDAVDPLGPLRPGAEGHPSGRSGRGVRGRVHR